MALRGVFIFELMSKTILISAGHGGGDSGAVGHGYKEAELALALRDRVAGILRAKGYEVLEDGADGVNDPLKKAIALAKQATVSAEIHFNASANPSATGVEVLAKPKHRLLARRISQAIAQSLNLRTRGTDGGYKADNSGQHHRLGFCEAGGVIIEVCFISNKEDLTRFLMSREQVAQGIADALADEAGGQPAQPASAFHTVQSGETLFSIARKYSVDVVEVKKMNGLQSDLIQVGQRLRIK